MKEYLNLFIDKEYPDFIDKYLKTKTLDRLKYVTQFCGCDYTKLYSPKFFYTRFDHSLVVAHMTWHFTHDKKETIAALLHDVGTPCFAHCIDYVFGDYLNQESSEIDITKLIEKDEELLKLLIKDQITLEELKDFRKYPILENDKPKLCTDRLDGVLHTCYIWLHTHSLKSIKKVYDNITVLTNEDKSFELGFTNQNICEEFIQMVGIYTKELQGNIDKYTMKYISELVKLAVHKNLITLDDLYTKKESEIIEVFSTYFSSWNKFRKAKELVKTEEKPHNFYISFDAKKRIVIPLIKVGNQTKRITEVSGKNQDFYKRIENYKDTKYAYIESIEEIK